MLERILQASWQIVLASWQVMLELSPWFLLGAVIAGLLHGLLPADFIHRKLQGVAGVFKAVALGVPLPLCSCGVVPAGIGLKRDGAGDGASVGFLISTPQTGVDSILVSANFLGWPFAIFKLVSATIMGIAGGLWANAAEDKSVAAAAPQRHVHHQRRSLRSMWEHGVEIIYSVRYWVLAGVLISAMIEVLVPPAGLSQLTGSSSIVACLLALLFSLPLYVCATASVPIAAALVSAGFPTGATLVFLMAGPATNIATVGAVYRQFGARTLAIYLLTIVVGSVSLGLLFEGVLGDAAAQTATHLHPHNTWWQIASAFALSALLAWFAARDVRRLFRHRLARQKQAAQPTATQQHIAVGGLHCGACVDRLENELEKLDGVVSATVQLKEQQAIVVGSASATSIADCIEAAGFFVDNEPRDASQAVTPSDGPLGHSSDLYELR